MSNRAPLVVKVTEELERLKISKPERTDEQLREEASRRVSQDIARQLNDSLCRSNEQQVCFHPPFISSRCSCILQSTPTGTDRPKPKPPRASLSNCPPCYLTVSPSLDHTVDNSFPEGERSALLPATTTASARITKGACCYVRSFCFDDLSLLSRQTVRRSSKTCGNNSRSSSTNNRNATIRLAYVLFHD